MKERGWYTESLDLEIDRLDKEWRDLEASLDAPSNIDIERLVLLEHDEFGEQHVVDVGPATAKLNKKGLIQKARMEKAKAHTHDLRMKRVAVISLFAKKGKFTPYTPSRPKNYRLQ
jgi:hypothetical protein